MVFEKVRAVICEQLDLDEDKVKMDSSIIDDLGADSLDIVDLIMTLEEEFDLEMADEEIENVRYIGDIVKHIEANI